LSAPEDLIPNYEILREIDLQQSLKDRNVQPYDKFGWLRDDSPPLCAPFTATPGLNTVHIFLFLLYFFFTYNLPRFQTQTRPESLYYTFTINLEAFQTFEIAIRSHQNTGNKNDYIRRFG
jgi:hypothetical protein